MRRARSPDKTRPLLYGAAPLLRDGKVERRRQGNAEIVLSPRRGATGGPAERFGHPGGPSRRRGWTEEERIYRCATTKGRAPQRTDRAAWGGTSSPWSWSRPSPSMPPRLCHGWATPTSRWRSPTAHSAGLPARRTTSSWSRPPRPDYQHRWSNSWLKEAGW